MGTGTYQITKAVARGQVYRAIAEILSLKERPVAQAVDTLLTTQLDEPPTPRLIDAASAARDWLEAGASPPVLPEIRLLFGDGFCHRCLPTVPACAAFYVFDAEKTRQELHDIYEWAGFECSEFITDCAGSGYVSQLLAFSGFCLQEGHERPGLLSRAAPLLQESFFDWAPIFARALVNSTTHPAALLAGLSLESALDQETALAV